AFGGIFRRLLARALRWLALFRRRRLLGRRDRGLRSLWRRFGPRNEQPHDSCDQQDSHERRRHHRPQRHLLQRLRQPLARAGQRLLDAAAQRRRLAQHLLLHLVARLLVGRRQTLLHLRGDALGWRLARRWRLLFLFFFLHLLLLFLFGSLE